MIGDGSGFDVESIAVHEIGHLLGLGHSAIGETEVLPSGGRRLLAAETVMFPLAFAIGSLEGRTLRPDDIAGVSDLYPTGDFRQATGSITGTIQKNGVNVVGAHVLAFHLESGRLVGEFHPLEHRALRHRWAGARCVRRARRALGRRRSEQFL